MEPSPHFLLSFICAKGASHLLLHTPAPEQLSAWVFVVVSTDGRWYYQLCLRLMQAELTTFGASRQNGFHMCAGCMVNGTI